MELRLNYASANPGVFELMMTMENFIRSSGLDHNLYDLIKLRSSQLNGCSFCIDMHGKGLLEAGETFERILLLTAWREVPIYTDRERAVLELTECVTRLSDRGVPQSVFDQVRRHFDDGEIATLIMAINVINCWNRLGVATGMFPGCMT